MPGNVEWSTGDSPLGPGDDLSCNTTLYALYVQIYMNALEHPSEPSADFGGSLLSFRNGHFSEMEPEGHYIGLWPESEPEPMPGRGDYDPVSMIKLADRNSPGTTNQNAYTSNNTHNGTGKFNLDSYSNFLSSHS